MSTASGGISAAALLVALWAGFEALTRKPHALQREDRRYLKVRLSSYATLSGGRHQWRGSAAGSGHGSEVSR